MFDIIVIGLIRQKYSLLGDTQAIDHHVSKESSVPVLNKIIVVCCALVNSLGSIGFFM